jgi:hypothetical protein
MHQCGFLPIQDEAQGKLVQLTSRRRLWSWGGKIEGAFLSLLTSATSAALGFLDQTRGISSYRGVIAAPGLS